MVYDACDSFFVLIAPGLCRTIDMSNPTNTNANHPAAPTTASGLPQTSIHSRYGAEQMVDFIADLHLQSSDEATYTAFVQYLKDTPAQTVFILGDLFEVWVGDDVLQLEPESFEAKACAQLRAAAQTRKLYFMHGNRDFLIGQGFTASTGIEVLPDPTCIALGEQLVLLSHGDALCLDDVDYQKFRLMSRNPAWQQQLLQQPLAVRRHIAQGARKESESRKDGGFEGYADLDAAASLAWLTQAKAQVLLHGHTHRPAEHALGADQSRIVMSDWDLQASPPRAEVMRWTNGALHRESLIG